MKTAVIINSVEQLEAIVKGERAKGSKIVVTKGVYDMFHDGHARYIRKAKELGDILILGVDDDELTRKTKGPNRPADDLQTRLGILEELRSVDFIVVRTVENSEGSTEMVSIIQPDILVVSETSTQYLKEDETVESSMRKIYVGQGLAKDLVVFPSQSSNSTTAKLRKISLYAIRDFLKKVTALAEETFGENKEELK